jgi:hypothetical protein
MRFLLLAVVAATPLTVAAQGVLGGQGFGYPVSGHSARAAGTAGALASFDELSPVNPAAVAQWQRGALFFHIEPEGRRTAVDGGVDRTSVVRFPLAGIAARITDKAAVSLSFATLLDRTYETEAIIQEQIGDEEVPVISRLTSSGAMNDVRVALGWRFTERLRGGVGLHLITGENRVSVGRDFPDTLPLADVSARASYSFYGQAVSAGVEWRPLPTVGVNAYTRVGGDLTSRLADTLVGSASVPFQLGGGVRYDGIRATVLAASWQRTQWTDLAGLGSASLGIRDANELSVGAETQGPPVFGNSLTLRVGARQRTLPFDLGADEVRERSLAFGVGYPLAQNRASVNVGAVRANRTGGRATESAWLVNIGLAIVP